MDLIGSLIVVGLVIVSLVSCAEHRPKHVWTEDECEVKCLKEEGYFDTSGIKEIETEILPVADAHVVRMKGVASGCKCVVNTKNPALNQYFKTKKVALMRFNLLHKGSSHLAQNWLKKKGIIVQLPHSPKPAIHSTSPKHHRTQEECEDECWKKEGYLDVTDTDKKKNANGLTEVALFADALFEGEEDGKTECKCVVDNSNMYLQLALNVKKVHLEAFVRQHQEDPHIARLWLASKGFKVVLGQKKPKQKTDEELAQESCVKDCIKSNGWVLLPQEHTGHRTRVAFADGKMAETRVFAPIVRNNKTISVWGSKVLCKCKPGAKLLAYLQEKGLTTKESEEFKTSFERGNGAQWLIKNHKKYCELEVQPEVNLFKEQMYLDELEELRPRVPKNGPVHTQTEEHHKMDNIKEALRLRDRGKRLLAGCLPIKV